MKVQQQQKKQQKCLQFIDKDFLIGALGIFGGFLMHVVIGSFNQWGIVNIYYTSFYKLSDHANTLERNAITFPLMMFCMGLTMKLGLAWAQASHPVISLIINFTLACLCTLISSFMGSMWGFIGFYAILFGLFNGLSFMVPMVECNKYFPGKKMIINGIITGGTGAGAGIWGIISYNYLNPTRIPPQSGYYYGTPELEGIAEQVPTYLKYLSLMKYCVALLGILSMAPMCIINRKKQNEQKKKQREAAEQILSTSQVILNQSNYNPNPNANKSLIATQNLGSQTKIAQQLNTTSPILKQNFPDTILQCLKSRIFYIHILIYIIAPSGCFMIFGNYKTIVKKHINDDQFLTIIGVIANMINGCSRYTYNLLFNKTGYKFTMMTILIPFIIVCCTIRFTVDSKGLYFICIAVINCCIGGIQGTSPTVAQQIYGPKIGSELFGFFWCSIAISNYISYIYVSNLAKTIGFDNIIYITLGMGVIMLPVIIFTKFQGPWLNNTDKLQFLQPKPSNQQVKNSSQVKKEQQKKVQLPEIILKGKYTNYQVDQNGVVKQVKQEDYIKTQPSGSVIFT